MDIMKTARMGAVVSTGGKEMKEGGEDEWRVTSPLGQFKFSFVTGRDHNKITRRRFFFTLYNNLTYILT